ncbi:ornithine cyclodeaminase/alanine dehydrogenase-like protein (mu-crystallin family) [Kitasatospora sp. MAA4]|uniref:ornithine cyclodeaminase family protein n=1 Tax=Kitasatospora sp. MAA4 TaxID=3035093 RepID=UPI0024749B64|nr:ornithine cyclodeaminase family protein [Kitasatospora sp. MAA4]MDH6130881.1 ornithine cyclodeaminase/alanine dehydrogenase-like protein (mu-crystallin family) [Kitasatospora sp. MAA4]
MTLAPDQPLTWLPVDLTPAQAAAAVRQVLRDGLDPEDCPARSNVRVPAGELLMMPAATAEYAGVKIAGVAPANPARGLPRITGSYLLLDGPTLQPLALLDGAALTALRTPAVTAVALDVLAEPDAAHLVLFGAGPQAYGHLDALAAIRPLERVTVVARRPGPARELAEYARRCGLVAAVGTPDAVAGADLVVCCTTSAEPLFDGALVPDRAVVAAVGSHDPAGRETDAALVRRAACYVESRAVALREAGDLLLARAEGATAGPDDWYNLAELVTGRAPVPRSSPRFFKSVGMAWQDLAVAAELHRKFRHGG